MLYFETVGNNFNNLMLDVIFANDSMKWKKYGMMIQFICLVGKSVDSTGWDGI